MKDFVTLDMLVKVTGLSASTFKNWSRLGIIDKPIKISYGKSGFRGYWSARTVEQAKLIRQCTQEGKSLIYARGMIRDKFGALIQRSDTANEIKLHFLREAIGQDVGTMLDISRLFSPDFLSDYESELREVATEKTALFALEVENAAKRKRRKRQEEAKLEKKG